MAQLVEHYTGDGRPRVASASSRLTAGGVTVLCLLALTLYPLLNTGLTLCHRKTCPNITEKLLTGT